MKKVFISYSWDNQCYKNWVLEFSNELKKFDVLPILDQTDVALGDTLPSFMEHAILDSDYVLVLCTPEYKKKADNRYGGVGYEESIITGDLFLQKNHRKYITVLTAGTWKSATPNWALGKYGINLTDYTNIQHEFQKLVQTIGSNTCSQENNVVPFSHYKDLCKNESDLVHFYDFGSEHVNPSDLLDLYPQKSLENDNVIRCVCTDGTELTIHVIVILQSSDPTKQFLIYTFDEEAENVDIYASLLVQENGESYLDRITDPEDWEKVKAAIDEL